VAACEQSGIPRTRDFNTGDNFGVDYFEVNQRRGLRWNASKAFLRPVRHRRNLTVTTGALVEGLLIEDRRCVGVRYRVDGTRRVARVREEVVLAAGAVNSPQLLELSGIGEPGVLKAAGVEPVHELPGVGENLMDHLQLRSIYKVSNARTLNTRAGSLFGKAMIAAEYAWRRSGPMSMSPSQLGAFARSSHEVARPDVEYHVQPLSLPKFGDPLHGFDAFTASVCNLRPTSRGTVHAAGPDPATPPVIAPNYLSTDEDRRVAAASLRLTRRIVGAPALARYEPDELLPGSTLTSDEDLARAAGDIGTTIFHPVGTCRMGAAGDARAVVDERLRVHGIAGLRVADASIMPVITSGNTNSPTLMIAEKASDMIREDRERRQRAISLATAPSETSATRAPSSVT
jgi:choline dehydrogenase